MPMDMDGFYSGHSLTRWVRERLWSFPGPTSMSQTQVRTDFCHKTIDCRKETRSEPIKAQKDEQAAKQWLKSFSNADAWLSATCVKTTLLQPIFCHKTIDCRKETSYKANWVTYRDSVERLCARNFKWIHLS